MVFLINKVIQKDLYKKLGRGTYIVQTILKYIHGHFVMIQPL